MILIENVDIDVLKVVYVGGLDGKRESLGVAEGAGKEGFMGGTYEPTINIEGSEGEGVCVVCEGTVVWNQWVNCVLTWEIDRYQYHTISKEGLAASYSNISGCKK